MVGLTFDLIFSVAFIPEIFKSPRMLALLSEEKHEGMQKGKATKANYLCVTDYCYKLYVRSA